MEYVKLVRAALENTDQLNNAYRALEKAITDSDKLSRCPQCKMPYMYTLIKNDVKSNKCPFCGY